MKGLQQKRI